MKAHIITIGDEILIGQIVDTNSAYISKALNAIGVSVYQISSVQDDKDHILESLAFAKANSDIIIVTGGLGPTKDDITKSTFCEYFDDELVFNQEVLDHVEYLFEKYVKKPLLESNKTQALVPSKATILKNKYGTAPGMWMEQDGKVFISMPGVPHEMKGLMEYEVLPRLKEQFHLPYILHKTLLTYGMGESAIAQRIEAFENELPSEIKLAYLPSLGRVRLRLSTSGAIKEDVDAAMEVQLQKLVPLVADVFVGYEENGPLELLIGKALTTKRKTLSIAESCTGGSVVQRFASNAGASGYLVGSTVTYATRSKIEVLGVDKALIDAHSVVSAEVAEAMAVQVQKMYNTDYAITTTGNAGPTKGDSDVAVGTVYIGIATPEGSNAYHFMMGNHRKRVIEKTVNKALELLHEEISKN
ncbi:CinA family nicotinamide mononucleotide deamidase-related protein [uncultured Dokdonia sp.]|uniref:CinA family nicotinamide mononucleotide deamidase-related protein n=1 Tax=uncultured Dokdonia sp. TaxID=575653 RepID=UPI002621FC33|nr:CinA family nicotinamide mononucleotide deamidase-related protein [uncultured Dokdonia sp.]